MLLKMLSKMSNRKEKEPIYVYPVASYNESDDVVECLTDRSKPDHSTTRREATTCLPSRSSRAQPGIVHGHDDSNFRGTREKVNMKSRSKMKKRKKERSKSKEIPVMMVLLTELLSITQKCCKEIEIVKHQLELQGEDILALIEKR